MQPVPPLSSEATIARILLYVGAGMAAFSALIMIGFFAFLMLDIPRAYGPPPSMALFPFGMLLFMGLLAMIGVIVNLVAAARMRRDARSAGILGIIAALLPPTNLFSLAGGILALVSPEGKTRHDAGVPPQGAPFRP